MPESRDPQERPAGRRDLGSRGGSDLLLGRFKAHGAAPYQYRTNGDASYYVKLLTSQGERTLWGKDLERAISEGETRPQVGDLIGARRLSREAVIVTSRQRDSQGRVTAQEERQAHRTRWVIEKVTFFAERARLARRLRDEQVDLREAVRAHPELKSTFLTVRAAEEVAAQRIANPQDRERFMELVRAAIAGSVRRGEPLPTVALTPKRKREEPTR